MVGAVPINLMVAERLFEHPKSFAASPAAV
jgi:hypothetical protein